MSELMEKPIFFESLCIKSEKLGIALVEPVLARLRGILLSLSDESYYNILIAVTEAVNNALIHGNKLNPEKHVDFSVKYIEDYIEITVRDYGDGFDDEQVADPRDPENLLKTCGRGVFIIKSLIKDAHFKNMGNGTLVTMKFDV